MYVCCNDFGSCKQTGDAKVVDCKRDGENCIGEVFPGNKARPRTLWISRFPALVLDSIPSGKKSSQLLYFLCHQSLSIVVLAVMRDP